MTRDRFISDLAEIVAKADAEGMTLTDINRCLIVITAAVKDLVAVEARQTAGADK